MTDGFRITKYDRQPVAMVLFSDSKSRAFWETLSPECTRFIGGAFDHVRSQKGELPHDWVQDAVHSALDYEFEKKMALFADEEPELPSDLFLEKLISALRREFTELDTSSPPYALWSATKWAFQQARFYKEAPDVAS